MGGSQSTRKLSVDNENAIQVSQEALDRIQSQLAAKQAEQPAPAPGPMYYPPPPYYGEIRPRQDYKEEEAYWTRRIENLKRAHEAISKDMEHEYQRTLQQANELFEAAEAQKISIKLPPCQNEKAKVLQCYSSNPKKSLLCSTLVNQFNDCVCQSRVSAVTAS